MTQEEIAEMMDRTYMRMFHSIAFSQELINSPDCTVEQYTALSIQAAWEGQEEYRKVFKEKDEKML